MGQRKTKEKCIIQTCTGIDLHYSTTISGDELLGFDIPNIIPTTVPCASTIIFWPKTNKLNHGPIAQCATLALEMLL